MSGRWEAAYATLWILVSLSHLINAQGQSGYNLSVEDILLLRNESSLQCFSRMQDGLVKEFTCFFMTEDSNSTYDFYYTIENPPKKKICKLHRQKIQEGGLLHICSFPRSDCVAYAEISLEVFDRIKNSSLYSRTVHAEDNSLPEPPSDVSIIQNDNIGQLLLIWKAECHHYKIRNSSKNVPRTIEQGYDEKHQKTLAGLAPGEEVTVQVSVKCSPSKIQITGHWSHWSPPVNAVVPQSADDITMKCFTEDLLNITCQWNSSLFGIDASYTLFYKTGLSEGHSWTQWIECFPKTNVMGQCDFPGNMHKRIRVKLSSSLISLNKTFYSKELELNKIIKTLAPSHLKQNETDKLCVSWDSPLSALSSHLCYEVNYRPTSHKHWMTISVNGPETAACLKFPWSTQFEARVRAKPPGPVYSDEWSDWSDVLTADVPAHASSRLMLLVHCSPVMLLAFAVLFILLFSKYFKKFKQYFWPPVPNLDKILQDFLADLNHYKMDVAVAAKPIHSEANTSIIEVLSKDDDSGLEEASTESAALLSSSDSSYSSGLYTDYVSLNKNTIILCSKGNNYVYDEQTRSQDNEENTKNSLKSSTDLSLSEHCLESDFSNHSYLFTTTDSKEREYRGQGNIYTNMPCN